MKIALFILCVFAPSASFAQGSDWNPSHPSALQKVVDDAVHATLHDFSENHLNPDQLAVTVIDLKDPQHPAEASYRGDVQIYPASVIKLFYLVAAQHDLETKRIKDTEELRRAMRDMIVDSYDEATSYVVDVLTDTTSGPELPDEEINQWWDKRNAVNRYFSSLGFTNINANKKPWCEGPYGRETQAIKLFTPKRNWLTTEATARLMTEIVTGSVVTLRRCDEMKELLKRNPQTITDDPDNQAKNFTARGIPEGTKLWSKAGWTSKNRHDCAYLELPDGRKLVIVTFTSDHAKEHGIIPTIARNVIANLPKE